MTIEAKYINGVLYGMKEKSIESLLAELKLQRNACIGMDLEGRLMVPKKSGHIDIITREFISSMTLPNFAAKVKLTDL